MNPPGSSPTRRGRRLALRLFLLAALVLAILLFRSSRAPSAVDRYVSELRARGEKLTLAELGLDRAARPDPLEQTLTDLDRRLSSLSAAGRVSTTKVDLDTATPGGRSIAWTQPYLHSSSGDTREWPAASRAVDQHEKELADLHAILRAPPADPGWDYHPGVTGGISGFVRTRRLCMALSDIAMIELRRGNLAAAHQRLLDLAALCRLNEDGWTLVNQMIRTAVLGLTTQVYWEALQAPGWTDAQLTELQQALERIDILGKMPRTLEVERANFLAFLDQLRGGGSPATGGQQPAAARPSPLRRLIFMLWRSSWGAREHLFCLQWWQRRIERERGLAAGTPWVRLPEMPVPRNDRYSRLLARVSLGGFIWSLTPNLSRADETVLRNETGRRLAIVAIALERHRLRHGQYPETLDALAPEFLGELPPDPADGQSLRYRVRADAPPLLYGLGPDGADGGGAWSGWRNSADVVWPAAVGPRERQPDGPTGAAGAVDEP